MVPYAIRRGFEDAECILVKHFGPKISVVAGIVSATSEYMVEVCAALTESNLRYKSYFLGNLCLELVYIYTLNIAEFVPFHIKN